MTLYHTHQGLKFESRGFPGGPVVKNPPCNAGTQVQTLVRELRPHMPVSYKVHMLRLLNQHITTRVCALQRMIPRDTRKVPHATTKAQHSQISK